MKCIRTIVVKIWLTPAINKGSDLLDDPTYLHQHTTPDITFFPKHLKFILTLAVYQSLFRSLPIMAFPHFEFIFFVPPSHLSACKPAVFAAGAGRYPGPSGYRDCYLASRRTGQFKPGSEANPAIEEVGKLEEVEEVRVETPYEVSYVPLIEKYAQKSVAPSYYSLLSHASFGRALGRTSERIIQTKPLAMMRLGG